MTHVFYKSVQLVQSVIMLISRKWLHDNRYEYRDRVSVVGVVCVVCVVAVVHVVGVVTVVTAVGVVAVVGVVMSLYS